MSHSVWIVREDGFYRIPRDEVRRAFWEGELRIGMVSHGVNDAWAVWFGSELSDEFIEKVPKRMIRDLLFAIPDVDVTWTEAKRFFSESNTIANWTRKIGPPDLPDTYDP